jgi:hypothetical protein
LHKALALLGELLAQLAFLCVLAAALHQLCP